MDLVNFEGDIITSKRTKFHFPSNSSSMVHEVKRASLLASGSPSEAILRSSVLVNNKTVCTGDHIFVRPKDLKLPEQNFTFAYENQLGKHIIYIGALSFLYKMHINCKNDTGVFSRNFFEMVPGDMAKIEYSPSDEYMEKHSTEPLEFECNSLFGLSNQC